MTAEPLIYVVDDDDAVRDALRLLLRCHGLHVEPFASAREFLQHRKPAGTACLILDERMPDLSGIELLRLLRKQGASLPTVLISGHGEPGLTESVSEFGVVAFLAKPFNPDMLVTSIRKAMELVPGQARQGARG
jgi:FixJ family two-component response regulator